MSRNGSPGDGRILTLLFAFTVLFIVVFGLGVFVGKKLSQQELKITKRFDETESRPSEQPVQENVETVDEETPAGPSPEIEEEQEEAAANPSPRLNENERIETEVKNDAVPKKTDTAPPAAPDKRLAEITEQIRREKEAAESKQKQPVSNTSMPPIDPEGLYTVQIGSFQDQKQANSLASSLQSKGYPVFIKAMTSPDNNKWYRVRVGTFRDIETAKAYGENLKNLEPGVKLVFITVNN